jgi:hypothetical protein
MVLQSLLRLKLRLWITEVDGLYQSVMIRVKVVSKPLIAA